MSNGNAINGPLRRLLERLAHALAGANNVTDSGLESLDELCALLARPVVAQCDCDPDHFNRDCSGKSSCSWISMRMQSAHKDDAPARPDSLSGQMRLEEATLILKEIQGERNLTKDLQSKIDSFLHA